MQYNQGYPVQQSFDAASWLVQNVQSIAGQGKLQQMLWNLVSQYNGQNQLVQQMVSTFDELYAFWSKTRNDLRDQQELLNATTNTVIYGTMARQAQRYPQGLTPQEVELVNQWLGYLAQLESQMNQYQQAIYNQRPMQSQQQWGNPQQGVVWQPQQQQQSQWPSGAQQQQFTQTPQQFSRHAQASQFQPQHNPSPRRSHFAGSGLLKQAELERQTQTPTEQTPNGDFQFVNVPPTRNPSWRPQNRQAENAEAFNPQNHQPVGREVAEQHHSASSALGSWDNDPIEWHNDPGSVTTFEEDMSIKANHSTTPQFMERISSDGNTNIQYGVEDNGTYREYTIADWMAGPRDPEFPWELAYRPATHTRRIAFDVKRQCYVQIIEENAMKIDDHVTLQTSSAVRPETLATKQRRESGRTRDLFNADTLPAENLTVLLAQRQEILDARLNSAQPGWDEQVQSAVEDAKERNVAYVAPEPKPSRDEVLSKPLSSESLEHIRLAGGDVGNNTIINLGTLDSGQLTEAHAVYAAKADIVTHDVFANNSAGIEFQYTELTPYILLEEQADEIKELLAPLSITTDIKTPASHAEYLASLAGKIPDDLWIIINDQTTAYVNKLLVTELGLDVCNIDSYASDMPELLPYLENNYGKKLRDGIESHINELMQVLCSVVPPDLTEESFAKLSTNIQGQLSDAIADRTVFVRRETTLLRIHVTGAELGLQANSNKFAVKESSSPTLYRILKNHLKRTNRQDGKAGFYKRVLLTDDSVRFTIHEGWLGDGSVIILRK